MATEEHHHQQQTKAQMQIQIQNQQRSATRADSGDDSDLGFGERAFSAAGAALISALLVNPLDIAKVLFPFYGGSDSDLKYRFQIKCSFCCKAIPMLNMRILAGKKKISTWRMWFD